MSKRFPSIDYMEDSDVIKEGRILSEKMDGGNSCIYESGYFHNRSPNSTKPAKDGRVKVWALQISSYLRDSKFNRMFFENLYDSHSIHYRKWENPLNSYYQCLFITEMVNGEEWVIPYQEQTEFCNMVGIGQPRTLGLADGITTVGRYAKLLINPNLSEGFVARDPNAFLIQKLPQHVGKWVRVGHVQTGDDWVRRSLPPNEVHYSPDCLLQEEYYHS